MKEFQTHTLRRTRSGEYKEVPVFLDNQCYTAEQIAQKARISINTVYKRRLLLKSIFFPKRVPKHLPGIWVKWMLRNNVAPEGSELKRMRSLSAA